MSEDKGYNGIPRFNTNENQSAIYPRWERWLRSFELMLESHNIETAKRKKAMLLHCGGSDLQDIFYAIPDADIIIEDEDPYIKTKEVLTNYFKPKINTTFERHKFRNMSQKEEESIGQFVTRLRQQAKYCSFVSVDDECRDQIIERCQMSEVRRRVLEKGDATLEQVLEIAQALEATSIRLKGMENTGQVAKISHKGSQKSQKRKSDNKRDDKCYRCGYKGHQQWEEKCPARGKKCDKCNAIGHFAKMCKTKVETGREKKQSGRKFEKRSFEKKDRVKLTEEAEGDSKEYAFGLTEKNMVYAVREKTIVAQIGGIPVEFVIDTGASCNVIDEKTWKMCKIKNIKCESRKTNKKIFAYAQDNKLDLLGEFTCKIKVGKKEVISEFVVIKGKGKALLGYETACKLEILKIGIECQVAQVQIKESERSLFDGIGKLKDYQLNLPIDENITPVAQPVRRIPFQLRDKVQKQIEILLKQDIIERVVGPTPWVSPIVPIEKKNNDVRICVDMRQANRAIVRERFPLPVIEEILNKIKGSQWFSTLDIKDAYHQIELNERSREITTFVTDEGLFRFKRLMFGISCAPEIFQRILRDVIVGIDGVLNFFDDILVFGRTENEHRKRLQQVFERLKEKGLTLNKSKCSFGLKEVKFLGFWISGSGCRPLESKVAAIENFRAPKTPEEVRSFLGLVNFCSSFIPNLATINEPLRKLTRKGVKFEWGKIQNIAFKELKEKLSNVESLSIFDAKAQTRVIADASPVAVGMVLTQKGENGWRVIRYASRSLTDCERRYSQTEKEALALVVACEKFHNWIYGVEFELITDHKALECIFSPRSKPCARIERWVLRLQPYKYKVIYEKGCHNIADPLSRLVEERKGEKSTDMNSEELYIQWVATEAVPRAMSIKEIEIESESDPMLEQVRKALLTNDWKTLTSSRFRLIQNELCMFNNIILRGSRIVIPEKLQQRTLEIAHEGHPGIVAMKNRLRSKVWWDGIDKDAEKYVRSCEGCQLVQKSTISVPLTRNILPDRPWESLAMDLLGPLPSGESILVVIDYYSRFYEIEILKSTTVDVIISRLWEIFARHGMPSVIICDNGPQFANDKLYEWARINGFKIAHSAPLWPQANGEVERQNRSLLKRLKIAHAEKRNWKEELLDYLLMYRSTPHSTTGMSPAEMLFGRKIKSKMPEIIGNRILDEETRERDAWNKLKGKDYYDKKKRVKETEVKPGDVVLVKGQKENKLSPEYKDTKFCVTDKKNNSVTITSPQGISYKRNTSLVKKFVEGQDEKESNEIKEKGDKQLEKSDNDIENNVMEKNVSSKSPRMNVTSRPKREIRIPKRFDNFVM